MIDDTPGYRVTGKVRVGTPKWHVSLRWWLIRKLAGKRTILFNAAFLPDGRFNLDAETWHRGVFMHNTPNIHIQLAPELSRHIYDNHPYEIEEERDHS